MSCQCYQIGVPFFAEDPDCQEHGYEARSERERLQNRLNELYELVRKLSDLIQDSENEGVLDLIQDAKYHLENQIDLI